MAYDIDFVEEAVITSHIKKFLLYPEFWKQADNQVPTRLRWNFKKFASKNLNHVPREKGVYAFILRPRYKNFLTTLYLFYVGRTTRTLRQRFKEYLDEKEGKGKPRKKVYKMLNQYEGDLYFYYATIDDGRRVVKCEECLLNTFVPHVNASIPKAKIKPELRYIYEQT